MNVHVRNGVCFNYAKNIENLEWKNLLVPDVCTIIQIFKSARTCTEFIEHCHKD